MGSLWNFNNKMSSVCSLIDKKYRSSEVIHTSDDIGGIEEEEKTTEKIDLVNINFELEFMKQRIDRLISKIKTSFNEENKPDPKDICPELKVEPYCSNNNEICDLQKRNLHLINQINYLVNGCKYLKYHIEELQVCMCEKARQILELQKKVAALEVWRRNLQHEFGVCIERFECIKHIKITWIDADKKLCEHNQRRIAWENKIVPYQCHLNEKETFRSELHAMRNFFIEFFEKQNQRFNYLENLLSSLEEQAKPKPAPMKKKKAPPCPFKCI